MLADLLCVLVNFHKDSTSVVPESVRMGSYFKRFDAEDARPMLFCSTYHDIFAFQAPNTNLEGFLNITDIAADS
jgi:hypothetical protein